MDLFSSPIGVFLISIINKKGGQNNVYLFSSPIGVFLISILKVFLDNSTLSMVFVPYRGLFNFNGMVGIWQSKHSITFSSPIGVFLISIMCYEVYTHLREFSSPIGVFLISMNFRIVEDTFHIAVFVPYRGLFNFNGMPRFCLPRRTYGFRPLSGSF